VITLNSEYLKWFKEIEKSMWAFFRLFDDLCSLCATKTIDQTSGRVRDKRKSWCCCMIDDQIHDNWQSLNSIQCRIDPKWHEKIKQEKEEQEELKVRRMPGNGPCPALGPKGCLIRHYRPITCTTQLCEKMLYVLGETGVIKKTQHAPLQIEDIISLPAILPDLYGVRKSRKINKEEVAAYIKAVQDLRDKFRQIDTATRKKLILQAIKLFMG
jgi:hypothetical protein